MEYYKQLRIEQNAHDKTQGNLDVLVSVHATTQRQYHETAVRV